MKKGLAVVLSLMMVLGILPFGLIRNNIAEAADTATYTKVTAAPADWSGEYLIVYEDTGYIFDGSRTTLDAVGNYQALAISDSTIKTDSSYSFTIAKTDSGYTIRSASGYFIGNNSDANALKSSTTPDYANTLSMNADGTVNIVSEGSYLRFNAASDQVRFRYFKSSTYTRQKPICLYKLSDGTQDPVETATPAPEATATPAPEATATPTPTPSGETTGNDYVRVTDASTLKAGDELILVAEKDSNYFIAGDISSQYMSSVTDGFTVSTDRSTVTVEEGASIVSLTLGGSEGAWTLSYNGKLLGATAVKKLAWESGTTTWSISISDNNLATVQNGTSSYGRFLYNYSSSRFTTYTSNATLIMLLPMLYRRTADGGDTPSCEHANTTTVTVDATCTEEGSVTVTCDDCGVVVSTTVISATGHSYDDGVVTTEPTCTQEGVMTYTCTACGDTYTKPIPANGHTYGDDDICDICGETKPNISVVLLNNGSVYASYAGEESIELPVLPNICAFEFVGWMEYDANYETTTTQPEILTGTYVCTADITLTAVYRTTAIVDESMLVNLEFSALNTGKVETAKEKAADIVLLKEVHLTENGSDYVVWQQATEAPATDITENDASIGDKYIIAAFYNGVYYALDNTSDANAEYIPGYPITDLAAINDTDYANYIYTVQYGTYNSGDNGIFTGLVFCAMSNTERYLHLNTYDINTDLTMLHAFLRFEQGEAEGTFKISAPIQSNASYSYIAFGQRKTTIYAYVTENVGHNYTVGTTHATCTEAGYADHYCTYCGDTYTDVVPALGHNWVVQTTDATCTEPGTTVKTCQRCGLVETIVGEALGHDLGAAVHTDGTANAASTHTHYCSRCDYSETEACSFTASISTANYMVTGFTKYTCSECSYSYTVTGETLVPYTLGAAARLDYKKIRFGGQLDVAILQATYDAGDTFTYGFDVACVYGDRNGAETFVQVGTVTWTDAMDKAATGQALTELLRAAGCKVYGYTDTTITFSAILYDSKDLTDDTGMPRIASAEFRFEAKILKGTATSTGRCLKNSIINIIDNNGASVETTM